MKNGALESVGRSGRVEHFMRCWCWAEGVSCRRAVVAAVLLLWAQSAGAQVSLRWNPGAPPPNPPVGGNGVWDTTTANWWDGAGNVRWGNVNFDSAVFGGPAGGQVLVDEVVKVGELSFATDGYEVMQCVLAPGATGLQLGRSVAPLDYVRVFVSGPNSTATISEKISGDVGLQMRERGTLKLTGANTFTGGLSVALGTVMVRGNSTVDMTSGLILRGPLGTGNADIRLLDVSTTSKMLIDGVYNISNDIDVGAANSQNPAVGKRLVLGATKNSGLDEVGGAEYTGTVTLTKDTDFVAENGFTETAPVKFLRGRALFSGNVTGAGRLNITGGGDIILNRLAGNSYTGDTTVQPFSRLLVRSNGAGSATGAGNILVDGGSLVTWRDLDIVPSRGRAYLSGRVTVTGGVLSAGVLSADSFLEGQNTGRGGFLSVRSLTMDRNAMFKAAIGGTQAGVNYSQVEVRGAVDITNAMLNLSLGFAPTADGQKFFILLNNGADPVVGEFAGMPDGFQFFLGFMGISYPFRINYTGDSTINPPTSTGGKNIVLTYIPAPGTGLVAVLVGVVPFSTRRRRMV